MACDRDLTLGDWERQDDVEQEDLREEASRQGSEVWSFDYDGSGPSRHPEAQRCGDSGPIDDHRVSEHHAARRDDHHSAEQPEHLWRYLAIHRFGEGTRHDIGKLQSRFILRVRERHALSK